MLPDKEYILNINIHFSVNTGQISTFRADDNYFEGYTSIFIKRNTKEIVLKMHRCINQVLRSTHTARMGVDAPWTEFWAFLRNRFSIRSDAAYSRRDKITDEKTGQMLYDLEFSTGKFLALYEEKSNLVITGDSFINSVIELHETQPAPQAMQNLVNDLWCNLLAGVYKAMHNEQPSYGFLITSHANSIPEPEFQTAMNMPEPERRPGTAVVPVISPMSKIPLLKVQPGEKLWVTIRDENNEAASFINCNSALGQYQNINEEKGLWSFPARLLESRQLPDGSREFRFSIAGQNNELQGVYNSTREEASNYNVKIFRPEVQSVQKTDQPEMINSQAETPAAQKKFFLAAIVSILIVLGLVLAIVAVYSSL
ncbi:MAG TPA: hypothetical protein DC049_10525 [Spirochaetia bacterium]|nr:hypothetical protein [Spirochaetia bacterium]